MRRTTWRFIGICSRLRFLVLLSRLPPFLVQKKGTNAEDKYYNEAANPYNPLIRATIEQTIIGLSVALEHSLKRKMCCYQLLEPVIVSETLTSIRAVTDDPEVGCTASGLTSGTDIAAPSLSLEASGCQPV
jgi:hypothetical protein